MARDRVKEASQLLGREVIAAGVFAVVDNYVAITAGGVAGSEIAGGEGALGVAGNVAGIEAARQANARAQGLSERLLVAVDEERIYLLEMPVAGGGPKKELLRFDRAGADIEIKKFGLSRRLTLSDRSSGNKVQLTGTTAPFSAESKGDKAVLTELA